MPRRFRRNGVLSRSSREGPTCSAGARGVEEVDIAMEV
jgi:hypothetical protein